ncbi:hypothetical protein KR49_04650 [Synechococcus sp. KORDI-49]|nr:hypothetical protein KR49_04650 [Synechococcus sp. KORDI-49]
MIRLPIVYNVIQILSLQTIRTFTRSGDLSQARLPQPGERDLTSCASVPLWCQTLIVITGIQVLGQKCWIWFKGDSLKSKAKWVGGWIGSVAPLGGVRIEHHDYVPCRVPQWRVLWEEPKDVSQPPEIPDGAQWKLWPTD